MPSAATKRTNGKPGPKHNVDAVREAYGPNYERLAKIKAKFDPANMFRMNQNIVPLA